MADEKVQLSATVSKAMKAQLVAYAKDHACTMGEVLEGAWAQYLAPDDYHTPGVFLHKLETQEQALSQLLTLQEKLITHLEKQTVPQKPVIATPEQMYPGLYAVPAPAGSVENEPTDVPPGRWSWRGLLTRGKASDAPPSV